jgi:uncharacterized protein YqeY
VNKQFITDEITSALRAHDKPRVSILRLVKNEIDTREKETKAELTDDEVTSAFKKVLKQTGETLEGSIKAGTNAERTAGLQEQVDILTGYLPAQVSGDELAAICDQVITENSIAEKRDMGRAIGLVVAQTGGNCDKSEVAKIVGSKLG